MADLLVGGAGRQEPAGSVPVETALPGPARETPVTIELYRPTIRQALADAWASRDAIAGLLGQVMTLKVPRSILGLWWVPINLVFRSVALAFIFGTILTVPSAAGVPYFVFAVVGSSAWWVLYRGTLFAMRSFQRFRHYVSAITIPLVVVPFAAVAQLVIEIGFIAVFLTGVFAVFWGIDGELYLNLSPELLFVPIALVWLLVFAAAIGLFTGPLFVRARDVRQVFRLALPFWMFVTPVVFPLESLSGAVRVAATVNPATAPVELFKAGLIGTPLPPAYGVAAGLGITVLLLVLGLVFTNRLGPSLLSFTSESDDLEDDV
jgi:lipopolysaccharide transport system permease protein